jgi:predicted Zn-dependent peptidase
MRSTLLKAVAAAALLSTGGLAAGCATTPQAAAKVDAKVDAAAALKPAPLASLVAAAEIPFEQFTLDNGLRVVVHTDRKTPIVAVSVWYGVGSADEPKGKTGFAHLFEHLMFNGSGGWDGEYFLPLEEVGATNANGTTWLDRTNYFQDVPTPALDLALFLEADRMGNLLPAVTQAKLDNQRGVVQNEKRQGDNEPYGLVDYAIQSNLFPVGHPYHHDTIGSMADLDAASMETVRAWFKQYYGPNNAVVVLAGDIDAAAARPLMERYFGAIPRGPAVAEPSGPVPDRTQVTRTVINDKVANTRLYFAWATPGQLTTDSPNLDIATTILAGGQSSRLHNALVRDEQLAIGVSGGQWPFQLANITRIVVDVKPGVDPAKVEARVEQLVQEFIDKGPSDEEVKRVATRVVSGTIRGFEMVGGFGGKAVTLAEGALYANDPAFYRTELARFAAANPQTVQAAAKAWLADGSHRVVVNPGERGAAELAIAGEAVERPAVDVQPTSHTADRSKLPPVKSEATLSFPKVERATLSSGVNVTFARRPGAPTFSISARFDAGLAADDAAKPGLLTLTSDLMREGAGGRTGREIIEGFELLGAAWGAGSGSDATSFSLTALKPNLAASLDLFADIIRDPAFTPAELERVRAIQLGRIAQEENNPNGIASRTITPMLYGPGHPYARVSSLGTVDGVKAITREDLVAFHQRWIRPDNMTLFVVGDASIEEVKAQLEAAFGNWTAPASVARGTKTFVAPNPQGVGRIVLLDRPKSPQSVIIAAMPLGVKGKDDPVELRIANEVLGGSFTARINTNLRETKGWSYGAYAQLGLPRENASYVVAAPVQSDRTADSIEEIKKEFAAFFGAKPITPAEFSRVISSNTRELPGQLETAAALRATLEANALLGRPDDYIPRLPARYRAMTIEQAMAAIRAQVDLSKMIWVVVGDAATVEPQLRRLGLPIDRK